MALPPIPVQGQYYQIYGKTFVGLTNPTLKQLDPNSSYYQRRKLLLEIKDAVEGTKTAASVSSIGAENMSTPSPGSGSPVLIRLGSGSRPMESTGSASATPLALQPTFNQSRPSLDALEPLEDVTYYEFSQHQIRPSNSPRPMSDPDLRLPPGRIPAHVTIETTEFSHKIPNIAPRQSSIAYSAINYRPNLNVPPQIVPRGSSRDYSSAHGLNVPQSNRGMSPISPPSPDGGNHPYSQRLQEPAFVVKDSPGNSKNGPTLIERRNNPVPHIQTHLDSNAHYANGQRPSYDNRAGPSKSGGGPYSDATVVGGTLGFGRRASHKRNHSSADVIQYPPAAATPAQPMVPSKPKSIQVTLDNENFKYVDITGIDNAVMLKEKIFSRMRILAEKNKYGIFETTELGSPLLEDTSTRGPPLNERQLMDLVLDADNKGVKLLVTPIMPLILPPDIDILNPKRGAVAATPSQPHSHIGVHHDRSSPFQGAQAVGLPQQDMVGYHQRERTADSNHHIFQPDPYIAFVQPPDDVWDSVHPHQPFPDSKHPHNTGRHPQQGPNSQANTSPYGSYQPQIYRYVDNPAHPHFQADDTRRPSIGNNSARTSPRFGPVINTSLGRMQKPGSNSPGIEGSPLSGKRTLPRNPNLSLVIGSNTDQDGKLVNHYARTADRSASPGGSMGNYRQQRDRMGTSHDSGSPNASYYEMNKANHPGFGDAPMVGHANYVNFVNSSGLPASPLSAGGKRSSYQHNFWGERPPLDFLLENFGRFFQDHDLDHPIIELHPPTPFNGSPMVSAQAILGSSGSAHGSSGALKNHGVSPAMTDGWGSNSTMSSSQGSSSPHSSFAPGHRGSIVHKKSIRIVAQEAKDRFSRQYSGSKVMRRKSTKMWGSRLAEVMPTNNSSTPSVGLGVHEFDEELSPIAGSPAVVTRASIAEFVKEAAQEHHILPEEPVTQEPDLLESQESLPALSTIPQMIHSQPQQQQQQRVVQVESGKVMDQSRQGIYQHPQSGTIKTFQYLKGGLIGRGSFGKVYHAFNLDTCEMIAIKQVDLPQTLSERNCDRLKTSVEALFSEMEVLKDLDHENIVQYLGFAQNEETANIFLEYVSGGSIESCLKRSGPFPEAVIRSFTRQILLGLEYIHSKKIVHRDIKAANVLVDEQGICKISDFGISKKNAQSQGGYDENVGSLQGSVFWMAPEMVTSKAYGAKVDIWSFGCLVLEMFTGQQPWKGYAPQQALFT
ncbi:hypothetical protein BGZ95_005044, partial [Linnemannia exigua]